MDFRILLEKITPTLKLIARRHILKGFYSEDDLYQEMCLYLLENYKYGAPIDKNESYIIKGCEFHIQNFLRKGRPKALLTSLNEIIPSTDLTLGDILEDKKESFPDSMERRLTVDELKGIGLTDSEKTVLSYLLKGYTVREAAKEMNISHVMILKHKKNIIKKWHRKFD
ncbi:MAG: sigma-70 family RNA polymerase sigma factor [Candidatus Omnitrophota bacterium]